MRISKRHTWQIADLVIEVDSNMYFIGYAYFLFVR